MTKQFNSSSNVSQHEMRLRLELRNVRHVRLRLSNQAKASRMRACTKHHKHEHHNHKHYKHHNHHNNQHNSDANNYHGSNLDTINDN